MGVEFASAASEEFVSALEYYESESPGLGAVFADDVEHAKNVISAFPSAGSPGPHGVRRIHLRRFNFALVYLERPDVIWVIAVEHHCREPGYWIDRL